MTLERADGGTPLTIRVERTTGSADRDAELAREIGQRIKNDIIVSGDIQIVDYGSLLRSERKSKRVFDNR